MNTTKTVSKAKASTKAPKGKASKAKAAKVVAKSGVIAELAKALKAGGGTVDQLFAKLNKKFPERGEGMRTTIKIQVGRLASEGKLAVKKERVEGTHAMRYWA